MGEGRDIFGNPVAADIQGNAADEQVQGSRPEDAQGNVPKDIWGNETGGE